jgi:hypothetical protein
MATEAELAALEDAAIEKATQPLSATVDGNSVTQRSAKDLADAIALAGQAGVTDIRQLFGFARTRIIPAAKQ